MKLIYFCYILQNHYNLLIIQLIIVFQLLSSMHNQQSLRLSQDRLEIKIEK